MEDDAGTGNLDPILNEPDVTGYLTLVAGVVPPEHRTIRLKRGTIITLGRGVGNDVLITGLQVSRKHCVFKFIDLKWHIQDLSTNGIQINTSASIKGVFNVLSNGDTVHLVPGGILCFKYHCVGPITNHVMDPGMVYLHRQLHNLRAQVASGSEPMGPINNPSAHPPVAQSAGSSATAGVMDRQADVEPPVVVTARPVWDTSNSSVDVDEERDYREAASPSSDVLFAQVADPSSKRRFESIKDKKKTVARTRKRLRGSPLKRAKVGRDSNSESESSSEADEFHDSFQSAVDYEAAPTPAGSVAQNEQLDLENREEDDQNPSSGSPSDSSSSDVNSEAMIALRARVKALVDKDRASEEEKNRLGAERDQLKTQLETANRRVDFQREEVCKDFMQIMEHELNCCVCNEIFIQATVIDCGHTFCFYCITEWSKKKNECPICRTAMTHRTKHVEIQNYIDLFHGLMSEETQSKREALIKSRVDEDTRMKEAAEREVRERAAQREQEQRRGARLNMPDNFVRQLLDGFRQTFDVLPDARARGIRINPWIIDGLPGGVGVNAAQGQAAAGGARRQNPHHAGRGHGHGPTAPPPLRVEVHSGRGLQEVPDANPRVAAAMPMPRRVQRTARDVPVPHVITLDDSQEVVPDPQPPAPRAARNGPSVRRRSSTRTNRAQVNDN